jgi:hypothetical protein
MSKQHVYYYFVKDSDAGHRVYVVTNTVDVPAHYTHVESFNKDERRQVGLIERANAWEYANAMNHAEGQDPS